MGTDLSAPLRGRLAAATFRLRTDSPELAAFAAMQLAPLAADTSAAPAVDAVVRWHDGQPPRQRAAAFPQLATMDRVDRDLYVTAEQMHWFRIDDCHDLYLSCTWRDQRLTVVGDFYYRLSNDRHRDRAKRILYRRRVEALRQRRFTTLLYYLVYYPCWWWLEQLRDIHPIHAAGVRFGDNVVLLGGASGVGKSTLAVALALQPGARLLSDSFVLHHGVEIYAVPEPILLDAWSRRWLGQQRDELQPVEWRYCLDRGGHFLGQSRMASAGQGTVLVLPCRARQPYVRQISPERAHQRMSAADLIINDLRRYWAFAAVMEQMVPGGLMSRREAQLAKLTGGIRSYEVGLTAEISCATAVASILDLLPSAALQAVGSGK